MDPDPDSDPDPEHCLDAADQHTLVEGAPDPRPEVRVHKRNVRPCELAGLWVHLEQGVTKICRLVLLIIAPS